MLTQASLFSRSLHDAYSERGDNDALKSIRQKAWELFLELGLPDSHVEAYRYLRLRSLMDTECGLGSSPSLSTSQLASYIYPESHGACLVFVNGRYCPELSQRDVLPASVVISPLDQAIRTYSTFLNNRWTRSLKEERDPFALLNTALHKQGVLLYLPPKTHLDRPLHVLNLIDTPSRSQIFPRLQLFLGAEASLEITESTSSLQAEQCFVSSVFDVAMDEAARLCLSRSLVGGDSSSHFFRALRATQKRDSQLKTLSLGDGAATVRDDYHVTLLGENSEVDLQSGWMLKDKREAHHYVTIEHQAPYCRSSQLFKGVVDDHGRSSFEGKIYVHKEAQKTDAFQLNSHLLLSERAEANSKPNLEIFADDVKASHGATTGQLDEEALFYLCTRGISKEKASALLVHGFLQDLMDAISSSSQKEELRPYFMSCSHE